MATSREVHVMVQNYLSEKGYNNSIGKYDRVIQAVKSILGQTLLEYNSPKLKEAVARETERMIKKYVKDATSIIEQKNGYILAVNREGTVVLAFPGEDPNSNPHMYLGKADKAENIEAGKRMLHKVADAATCDATYKVTYKYEGSIDRRFAYVKAANEEQAKQKCLKEHTDRMRNARIIDVLKMQDSALRIDPITGFLVKDAKDHRTVDVGRLSSKTMIDKSKSTSNKSLSTYLEQASKNLSNWANSNFTLDSAISARDVKDLDYKKRVFFDIKLKSNFREDFIEQAEKIIKRETNVTNLRKSKEDDYHTLTVWFKGDGLTRGMLSVHAVTPGEAEKLKSRYRGVVQVYYY